MSDSINDQIDNVDLNMLEPLQIDMVIGDKPLQFSNDADINLQQIPLEFSEHASEMLESGLLSSDVDYFIKTFKDLNSVKHMKLHCTSCNRHMSTAALAHKERHSHPLLKVLICENCYMFYCTGDFLTDKDGSELYCRWCGEGGQVFCCTKCPYVFCKKCITRNLGRGTAYLIQNSDDWLCFSCNPCQINEHRVTFWAIQKYSRVARSLTCQREELVTDFSTCFRKCNKKRMTRHSLENSSKKPKLIKKANKSSSVTKVSESKAKSTSDIITIPDSSVIVYPLPLYPSPLKIIKKSNPELLSTCNSLNDSQNNASNRIPYLSQSTNSNVQLLTQPLINKTTHISPLQPLNNHLVLNIPDNNAIIRSALLDDNLKNLNWFHDVVMNCKNVNEYISTEITSLSLAIGQNLTKQLNDEIHKSFQNFLTIAIGKLENAKRKMDQSYKESFYCNKQRKIKQRELVKKVQSFTENDFVIVSDSDDNSDGNNGNDKNTEKPEENTQDTKKIFSKSEKPKKLSKTDTVIVVDVKPEDIMFEMDVINASDEESTVSSENGHSQNTCAEISDVNMNKNKCEISTQSINSCTEINTKMDSCTSQTSDCNEKIDHHNYSINPFCDISNVNKKEINCKESSQGLTSCIGDKIEKFKIDVARTKNNTELKYITSQSDNFNENINIYEEKKVKSDNNTKPNLSEVRIENKESSTEKLNSFENQFEMCVEIKNDENIRQKSFKPNNIVVDDDDSITSEEIMNDKNDEVFYGDFEEILTGSVVMRTQTNLHCSFEDAFSKFIKNSNSSTQNLNDIFNEKYEVKTKDNANNVQEPNKNTNNSQKQVSNNDDIGIENELVTLRHLAENCVPSSIN